MTAMMIFGVAFLVSVSAGLAALAASDLPDWGRDSKTPTPDAETFSPYEAEARAYLIDRDAA